jgi:hypothetical protein
MVLSVIESLEIVTQELPLTDRVKVVDNSGVIFVAGHVGPLQIATLWLRLA